MPESAPHSYVAQLTEPRGSGVPSTLRVSPTVHGLPARLLIWVPQSLQTFAAEVARIWRRAAELAIVLGREADLRGQRKAVRDRSPGFCRHAGSNPGRVKPPVRERRRAGASRRMGGRAHARRARHGLELGARHSERPSVARGLNQPQPTPELDRRQMREISRTCRGKTGLSTLVMMPLVGVGGSRPQARLGGDPMNALARSHPRVLGVARQVVLVSDTHEVHELVGQRVGAVDPVVGVRPAARIGVHLEGICRSASTS